MSAICRLAALLAAAAAWACGEAPSAERDGELRVLVDSLLPRLESLSGLEARSPVRVASRSAAQVRAFVEARLAEDFPPEEIDGVRAAYALLGLVPDTLDLTRLLTDLYAEQIVGYYDPDSTTLYVIDGVPRDALRPVLAHELVHALQDQHIDLDSLIARERGNDRQIAAQAAIEGHATLVMLAFLAGEAAGQEVDPGTLPNPAEQIRAGLAAGDAFPVFRSAPRLLREVLLFPYADGAAFAWRVWAARTPRPQLPEIIPSSSEQVLEPERRFLAARDEPTDVAFDGPAPWRTVYENSLGALETRLFLEIRGGPAAAAAGWDGDRYRVLEDPRGRRALVWHSVWDDAASARAFASAARTLLQAAGDASAVSAAADGTPAVTIVIAAGGLTAGEVPAGSLDCAPAAARCRVR